MSFWKERQSLKYKFNQLIINNLFPTFWMLLACLITASIVAMAYTTYLRVVLPDMHTNNWNNGYKQAILDINNLKRLE